MCANTNTLRACVVRACVRAVMLYVCSFLAGLVRSVVGGACLCFSVVPGCGCVGVFVVVMELFCCSVCVRTSNAAVVSFCRVCAGCLPSEGDS